MMDDRSLPQQIAGDALRWVPVGLIPIVNGLVRLSTYQAALGDPAAGWVSASLDCAFILLYALALAPPRRIGVRAATWLACTTLLHFALGGSRSGWAPRSSSASTTCPAESRGCSSTWPSPPPPGSAPA